MTDQSPFFTVIIPTRNRPQVMQSALESVLAQNEQSIEIIIINDGSDTSHQPAYNTLSTDRNITLINLEQTPNGHGPSYALNRAVERATGKYIAFLDDDDQWTSEAHLSKAKQNLTNSQADLYLSLQAAYKNNQLADKTLWLAPLLSQLDNKQTITAVDANTLIKCNGFAHRNNLIIKQALYKKINGHDENLRYEEDREFYLRAIEQANGITFVADYVSQHNIPTTKNNLSSSQSEINKLRARLYLFDSIITQSNNSHIINYIELQKTYSLKTLAETFYKQKNYTIASHYAKQAVFIRFNIKWLLYTLYLKIKQHNA